MGTWANTLVPCSCQVGHVPGRHAAGWAGLAGWLAAAVTLLLPRWAFPIGNRYQCHFGISTVRTVVASASNQLLGAPACPACLIITHTSHSISLSWLLAGYHGRVFLCRRSQKENPPKELIVPSESSDEITEIAKQPTETSNEVTRIEGQRKKQKGPFFPVLC